MRLFVALMLLCPSLYAFNPITDVRDNWKWTFGEQAEAGTAIKLWGGSDIDAGRTASSFLAGIADYRFLKFSYGAIRDNISGANLGDTFKVGVKLSGFFDWFKNPPTESMSFLKNFNIGPAYSIPVFTAPHAGILFIDFNYVFGEK